MEEFLIEITEEDYKKNHYFNSYGNIIEYKVRKQIPGLSGYGVWEKKDSWDVELRLFSEKGHCQVINLPEDARKYYCGHHSTLDSLKHEVPFSFVIKLDYRLLLQYNYRLITTEGFRL